MNLYQYDNPGCLHDFNNIYHLFYLKVGCYKMVAYYYTKQIIAIV